MSYNIYRIVSIAILCLHYIIYTIITYRQQRLIAHTRKLHHNIMSLIIVVYYSLVYAIVPLGTYRIFV